MVHISIKVLLRIRQGRFYLDATTSRRIITSRRSRSKYKIKFRVSLLNHRLVSSKNKGRVRLRLESIKSTIKCLDMIRECNCVKLKSKPCESKV